MASMLYPDHLGWTEEDLAFALSQRTHEVWSMGEALSTIIDAACDEAVGDIVTKLRMAEGVDTAAVDAALGVEQDEEGEEP